MNRHALVDSVFLALVRRLTTRHFHESVDSAPFHEHLTAARAEVDTIRPGCVSRATVQTLVGELAAEVKPLRWRPGAPTLVWHHGGGEQPYDRTIERVLRDGIDFPANVLAVQSPYHSSRRQLSSAIPRLENWAAMLASGVALTEAVLAIEDVHASAVAIGGYSLGGFVTNLHHVHHDTADLYFPFAAGSAMGQVIMDGVLRGRATAEEERAIRAVLDLEGDFSVGVGTKVLPVLNRHDQLNRLEHHLAAYGAGTVTVWDKGHMTAVGKRGIPLIRAHLIDGLNTLALSGLRDSKGGGA